MNNEEALLKTAQTGNVKMAELVLKYLDIQSDWYLKQAVIEAINEGNNDYAKEAKIKKILDWYKTHK